jgi:TPR repeat protein
MMAHPIGARLIMVRTFAAAIILCSVAWGVGVSQEHPTAPFDVAVSEAKALQGDVAAMVQLGKAYWDGKGVPADVEKGRPWLERAAEKGSLEAQMFLGMSYFSGVKLSKDPQLASKYLLQAAQQEHVESTLQSSQALAQYFIAQMYEQGRGLEKSHDKAIQFLQMAANNGSPPAQFDLAALYNDGSGGMTTDKVRACQLFEKAADQGHLRAMHNAGYCYQVGIGGKKDENKAIDYYTKAAEAGSTRSQRNLGLLFGQLGQAEKAYFWLRVAESSGDTEKKSLIDAAKEHLPASQVETVEKEILVWLNAHKAKKQ